MILWSLFNEENALQGTEQGRGMTRRMLAAVKSLDATRPVTAAMNNGQLSGDKVNPNGAAQELDVIGINYQVDKYDKIRAAYPNKPIISSEDTSQVMTRRGVRHRLGQAGPGRLRRQVPRLGFEQSQCMGNHCQAAFVRRRLHLDWL